MKVSNHQKPQGDKTVSREELNNWQRQDAKKFKEQPESESSDEGDSRRQ
jgi:hypothetical protein